MADRPLEDWIWVDGKDVFDKEPVIRSGVEELGGKKVPPSLLASSGSSKKALRGAANLSEERFPYHVVRRLDQRDEWRLQIVKHKTQPWREYLQKRSPVKGKKERRRSIELLKTEACLLRELRHEHVVQVFETIEHVGNFSILMAPVVDTHLSDILHEVDMTEDTRVRKTTFQNFREWAPCLTKALAYLHSQHVEHGSIQPSTILVNQDRVVLSGFGRARRVDARNATNSRTMELAGHRPASMYGAAKSPGPLVIGADDIYGLGCVFVEMATAICDRFGALGRFKAARARAPGNSSTASYAHCQKQLVQWISMLSTMCPDSASSKSKQIETADWTRMLVDVAFRMLDPSPNRRPTADLLLHVMQWFCFDSTKCLCEGAVHPEVKFSNPFPHPGFGRSRKVEDAWDKHWGPLLYNLEAAQYWDFDIPISPWEIAKAIASDGVAENVVICNILLRAAARRTQPFQVGGPPHSYFLDKSPPLAGSVLYSRVDPGSLSPDFAFEDLGQL